MRSAPLTGGHDWWAKGGTQLSLCLRLSLSVSVSLVTQINKGRNVTFAACADRCHHPQHQEVRQKVHLVIGPHYFPPICRSVCKIYGVIWRVDCFVRSECGHHDVAEAQQHTQHECI